MEKPTKHAISYVLTNEEGNILLVQRPADDEDLPNVWGLPAGSVKDEETWEDAVRRSGQSKLGIQLEPTELLEEGWLDRGEYTLHMQLFRAAIQKGTPQAPQDGGSGTQYQQCKWFDRETALETIKEKSAPSGSLCCTLYLWHNNRIDQQFLDTLNTGLGAPQS